MNTTQEITIETVVTHGGDQVSTDLDGEVVLMSIEQSNYYGFDKILSKIWTYIETPMSVSSLCGKLVLEYDVEREVCEQDVLKILNRLHEKRLISIQ